MKRYINGLFLLVFSVLLFTGCNSETNMPEVIQLNYPKITPDPASDQLINMLKDPALFHGKMTVDLYFPNKDLPEAANLVVAKNGDYDNVKQIQEVTQFPSTVEITGAKLQELFGKAIVLNDYYEIGLDTRYNGVVYKAFNPDAVSYSSNLWSLPGSNPIQVYDATYLLDLNDFTGSFHVNDMEFWETEYDVTISRSSTNDNQLIVVGMLGEDGDMPSITIDVNMATQIPSLNNQIVLHDIAPFGVPDVDLAYNGAGKFNIPSKTMTFSIKPVSAHYTYGGPYSLVFTKN